MTENQDKFMIPSPSHDVCHRTGFRSFAAQTLHGLAVGVALSALLVPAAARAAETRPPRVAVWNPEKGTAQGRFKIDLAMYDRVAQWLREDGAEVARLTAAEIADPAAFNAGKFDAVLFGDEAVPRQDIKALQSFADAGGVLVALGGKLPFNTAVEPAKDGLWQMSPMQPAFAWKISDILMHFNTRYVYKPAMQDQARRFPATKLLQRYLPQAKAVDGILQTWWLPTVAGAPGSEPGEYYPLIRSLRLDGVDVTPQLAVVQRGKRHAIYCLNAFFTDGSRPELWPLSRELLTALARISRDLKTGALVLTPEMKVSVPEDLPPPEPLRERPAGAGIIPEGAKPLAQWGRFDGSSFDLDQGPMPRRLLPGETVLLPLPTMPAGTGPLYLRIRGAFNAPHSGLKVETAGMVLLNETFIYNEAAGDSNHTQGPYTNAPVEFHRVLFVPAAGTELRISNPGIQPVYFDAAQLETHPVPAPERWIGQYAGFASSMPDGVNTIPVEKTKTWSVMRCDLRSQFAGAPGDPKRWDVLKKHLDKYAAMSDRWNLIFMGCPEWAAISPERYADGKKAGRPHCVPPDPAKYAEIVEWVIENYDEHIAVYEIWNETDITQFWRGTPQEYLAFAKVAEEVIRRKAPGKPVILAGMAGVNLKYVTDQYGTDLARKMSLVPFHPYVGEGISWDIAYGKLEGILLSMGNPGELYPNESGFPYKDAEWFKSGWTPERQRDALGTGMARILHHTPAAKLTVFLGGGDDQPYGIYDRQGQPRPAGLVFEDYLALGRPGARRLDFAMAPADGTVPLEGLYAAASVYPDGSAVFVLNPVESTQRSRTVTLQFPVGQGVAFAKPGAGELKLRDLPAGGRQAELTLPIDRRTVISLPAVGPAH